MKAKTLFLLMDGYQVALATLLLILVSVSIVAHAVLGHLGFLGWIFSAIILAVAVKLFLNSLSDYRQTKNEKEIVEPNED